MAQMSPGSWLALLEARLEERRGRVELYTAYREGEHRLRFMTAKFRQTFGSLFQEFADNWCGVIVDAPVERLRVQGFRYGSDSDHDSDAWDIWQANNMDAQANLVHREAVTCEEAYWLVEPPRDGAKVAKITAEHPSQVIVACDPADRRQRRAALKKWIDDDGFVYANVYLPDGVYKFRSADKATNGYGQVNWTRYADDPGGANPLRVVPVVPITNSPTMRGGGRSDLRDAIPLQDAINKTLLDMFVASEMGAFPARVLLGIESFKSPDGTPIPAERAEVAVTMNKLLTLSDPNAKIAQFQATDLSNYVHALEPLVQHLAAQTRTPPHYLLGKMVNASGDALKVAETGLVARIRDKMMPFGEGHEEAIRLAFAAVDPGDPRASETSAETIWADPEARSFGELVDGLVKLRSLNIPDEILWERAGFSPQDIERIKILQAVDNILVEPRSSVPVTTPTATLAPSGDVPVPPAAVAPAAPSPAGAPPARG